MLYEYRCKHCDIAVEIWKSVQDYSRAELCCCGEAMDKVFSVPHISGTRDGFGIGKEFRDEATGQTIDNWKSWEKAGYKPATECHTGDVKEKIKRKIDKINSEKRITVSK